MNLTAFNTVKHKELCYNACIYQQFLVNNMLSETNEIIHRAWRHGIVVPGFNIPHLPMMKPVVDALRDTGAFGLIMVARLEWMKFKAGSLADIRGEYDRVKDPRHTRLHLDHVPVIDEDGCVVDYASVIKEALALGYDSVMLDGSRLPLAENIRRTREVVEAAHARGVPVEAELGAVMGHEKGPLPDYEELFASGKGFTDPEEARGFAAATAVDWLSVAIGNVHGAISDAVRSRKKVEARLNIEHLRKLRQLAPVPFVLHGGSGIPKSYVMEAVRAGVAKINIATAIRQPYEAEAGNSIRAAQAAVYKAVADIIRDDLELEGSADMLIA